jgi:hypothetical protein
MATLDVTADNINAVLLADEFRNKPWSIVTGNGVFKSDRLCERWIVPVPMDPLATPDGGKPNWLSGRERPLERVFKLARIRVDADHADFTAFYEYETTRSPSDGG